MSDIFGGEEAAEPAAPEVVEAAAEPVAAEPAEVEPLAAEPAPTVPLSALNESRAQLRQTQNEMAQMREQLGTVADMKRQLDEFRGSQQQQASETEFNTDPLGTIQKQIQSLDDRMTNQQESDIQQQSQAEQSQQLFSSIASQVNEFKSTVPDYDDALAHVLNTRKAELMAMGVPEFQTQQRVSQEAQEIALTAIQSGENPGKVVYDLAKVRGYGQKQTSKKLETIEKGQKASGSLSGSSGSEGESGFSLTEIDSMSHKQFDAWWEKEMKPQQN